MHGGERKEVHILYTCVSAHVGELLFMCARLLKTAFFLGGVLLERGFNCALLSDAGLLM